jgi:hypothetical protein
MVPAQRRGQSRPACFDRRVDGDVTRLDPLSTELLPGPAREALERGDTDDQALLTALGGVVQTEVHRDS